MPKCSATVFENTRDMKCGVREHQRYGMRYSTIPMIWNAVLDNTKYMECGARSHQGYGSRLTRFCCLIICCISGTVWFGHVHTDIQHDNMTDAGHSTSETPVLLVTCYAQHTRNTLVAGLWFRTCNAQHPINKFIFRTDAMSRKAQTNLLQDQCADTW
jgi:hypothetical protein